MALELGERESVRLAIEGCGHGTLHAIYASVEEACKRKGWPEVDLLIIGGDFQAVRNAYDLNCVSMPAKYRSMCDFHEYYSGQRKAPYLTIFVGGNHEASNYLFELYYGGWVAPNIYYMGAANVLRFGPLRIAGLSGIWKGYNYRKPHHERLPYNESDVKSIYHVRELDVRKLLQIRSPVDIGISHDWPKGVEWKGDYKQLFRFKKHLEDDAKTGQLGSVAAQQVMDRLRPHFWFSAHLHCKYAAIVEHDQDKVPQQSAPANAHMNGHTKNDDEINLDDEEVDVATNGIEQGAKNGDEIDLDMEDEDVSKGNGQGGFNSATATGNTDEIDLELEGDEDGFAPVAPGQGLDDVKVSVANNTTVDAPVLTADEARAALPAAFNRRPVPDTVEHPADITNKTTHFLALDKCVPNHHFLQLMSVPFDYAPSKIERPFKLCHDPEWLAITRMFALDEPLVVGKPDARPTPPKSQAEYRDRIASIQRTFEQDGMPELQLPENFEITAPVYDGGNWNLPQYSSVEEYPNPQTAWFCKNVGIPNPFEITAEERAARLAAGPRSDPEAERFAGSGRGRRDFGRGRGGGFGRGRGRGRGGNRGRSRGR